MAGRPKVEDPIRDRKAVSSRLSDSQRRYVETRGRCDGFNSCLISLIQTMETIENISLKELHYYFSLNEWCFMAECLRDVCKPVIDKNELHGLILKADYELYTKYGIEEEAKDSFFGRINRMQTSHVFTAVQRIMEYWDDWRENGTDLHYWAQKME